MTKALAEHIVAHRADGSDEQTERWAALHVLDTVAAMVSGTTLAPGARTLAFARTVDSGPVSAARTTGMLAHSDETDDSHQASLTHPGCAVVPAALAMAEHRGDISGSAFVRAVTAGYEVTARLNLSLGTGFTHSAGPAKGSSHAVGGVFGAAVAASCLAEHDVLRTCYLLSYTAQLAAGTTTWLRDTEHVEKAFVFGGMPASNGVLAALMVSAGLPAVEDVFDGTPNFLEMYSEEPDPDLLAEAWRAPYAVAETNVKLHPVGSPAQALVEAAETVAADPSFSADAVEEITIWLPPESVHVVDNPGSPNLNVRFLVAAVLREGRLTFARAHDHQALTAPEFAGIVARCSIRGADDLARTRGGKIDIRCADGRTFTQAVRVPLGTAGRQLGAEQVTAKAFDLLSPVLGDARATELVDTTLALPSLRSVDELTTLVRKHLLERPWTE